MSLGFVIVVLVSAFLTGAIARLVLPGPDPMPAWLTIVIGLTGSIVGAVVGDVASNGNRTVVALVSFAVAIGLVAAYRVFVQKRPVFGPGARKFPERGIGVEQYRKRLQNVGIDPDTLQPDPEKVRTARLHSAIDELHRAGLLDDEELTTMRDRVESAQSGAQP